MSENPFCRAECREITGEAKFGVCDDSSALTEAAYISFDNGEDWIATVKNDKKLNITFLAIDNCIRLKDKKGNDESTCDCALITDDTLSFIELKDRSSSGWFKKGAQQIENTIHLFVAYQSIDSSIRKNAFVANKAKPRANESRANVLQEFKQKTGFNLYDKAYIEVS